MRFRAPSSSNLAGLATGAAVCTILFWVFKAGDPGSMQFAGIALANPETQREKILVDNIGVHGIHWQCAAQSLKAFSQNKHRIYRWKKPASAHRI